MFKCEESSYILRVIVILIMVTCTDDVDLKGLSYPSDVEVDECQMQQHTVDECIDGDKYVNCNCCNLRALFTHY
ncbi:GSCOCT00014181001.2-RA-CDS [Cotesia congregata]|uniref:Cc_single_18.12 n=1 Tax=Cotesia congregata TaxID=51543 RepID=S6D2Z7_COTCN|nr:GSCOCT00014181001.2-RA-CDS [Cotesia congregata]CAG5092553.1 cc_single_18.12 [Cotesia congregata]CCQ71273.1 hypothetical protein CcBV_18.12 [Cotesia congregata]